MHIAIVYDSSTGKTRKAAETMSTILEGHGHQCKVQSAYDADPAEVAKADLILLGGWVKGLFVIRQHPSDGAMWFIDQLGDMAGTKVALFCTYMLAAGSTLDQMVQPLEGKGAEIIGRFKYRGSEPDRAFASFAESLN
ncbi:MAG: hypothetical protein HND51_19765 [Chloroflexi bacterium]|nr:hypothetical protein [Chloroflexota bacterium]